MAFFRSFLISSVFFLAGSLANAETVRWARTADALTLDPHAQNEAPTAALAHQMMEPLVMRDMSGWLVPALATHWAPDEANSNIWNFKLREGVRFHDGSEFDSEDVVFSFNRAMSKESNYKELLASVKEVRADGKYGVSIVTNGPNPIMPTNLSNIFIMDKQWTEKNNAAVVQDYNAGQDTFSARNTNGTGPYILVSREPNVKTVLKINPNYWGIDKFPMQVTKIIFTPIPNQEARVSALIAGEVNFIQDVPVQDLERVENTGGLHVLTAPQNRVIFFGMNQSKADLESDDVWGRNPLADKWVRTAMNLAIDREAIKKLIMHDQSIPAGVIMPPFVNGWTKELDQVLPPDIAAAREMMRKAGYEKGFSIRLDCPNNRYINDESICQAAVWMLSKIGIKVNLVARPKSKHFQLITNLETDFYMLGWGVPTYDSEYIFNLLVHSKDEKYGSWNATRFSDPELDKKIVALASMTNLVKRDQMIDYIWKSVKAEKLYIPIHHQVLNWGMADSLYANVASDDTAKFKYFIVSD